MNIAKVKEPTTKITLEGKDYELKFTLNSMAELEDAYGSIDKAMEAMGKQSIKAIRFFLWAGMLHANENLTERQVGNMVTFEVLPACAEALGEALKKALPTEDLKQPAAAVGAEGAQVNPNSQGQ